MNRKTPPSQLIGLALVLLLTVACGAPAAATKVAPPGLSAARAGGQPATGSSGAISPMRSMGHRSYGVPARNSAPHPTARPRLRESFTSGIIRASLSLGDARATASGQDQAPRSTPTL